MRKHTKKQEKKPGVRLWPLIAFIAVGLLLCGIGALHEGDGAQPALADTTEAEDIPQDAAEDTAAPVEEAPPENEPENEPENVDDSTEADAPEAATPEADADDTPQGEIEAPVETPQEPEPNVQPEPDVTPEPDIAPEPEPVPDPEPEPEPDETIRTPAQSTATMVWIPTRGGTKYHRSASCSNMIDPEQVTQEEAQQRGFTACKRCYG